MTIFCNVRIVSKCGVIRKPSTREVRTVKSSLAYVGFEQSIENLFRADDIEDDDAIMSRLMSASREFWPKYLFVLSYFDEGSIPFKIVYVHKGCCSAVEPHIEWPRPDWKHLGIKRYTRAKEVSK